jgi:hypothetical protein
VGEDVYVNIKKERIIVENVVTVIVSMEKRNHVVRSAVVQLYVNMEEKKGNV